MIVTRCWGKWGDVGQRVQTFSYKMNKFWGYNVQQGDNSYQYFIVSLKSAKRVDLKCSHHTQKMVTM